MTETINFAEKPAEEIREELRKLLNGLKDTDYKEFNCRLMPGVNGDRVMGIRIPALRSLAKKLTAGEGTDGKRLLAALESCGRKEGGIGGTELYFEEIMLQGMLIGMMKLPTEQRFSHIGKFIPRIDNWAVCDTFCSTLKFASAAKAQDREQIWSFLQPYLHHREEYFVRFGLVMLLDYFVEETYIGRVLALTEEIRHPGYYVKMAAAWLLSVCYVKFPQQTEALLENNTLDDFTHNKAIQKIRESFRVSGEDKERLSRLKRK